MCSHYSGPWITIDAMRKLTPSPIASEVGSIRKTPFKVRSITRRPTLERALLHQEANR